MDALGLGSICQGYNYVSLLPAWLGKKNPQNILDTFLSLCFVVAGGRILEAGS